MRDVDRDLLKLLAFSDEEIEEFLPKWEIARKALRLDDATIANAIDHFIPENWDIKYLGVRKLIGAYLREGVEQCMTPTYKAEGKKIVYGILPAISNYYYAVKEAGGDDVFIGFPDHMLVNILNSFFHAAAPWLDIAESYGFTYGCRHCPLNKMRVAAYVENVIAAPDIIWSWGFNCDEGPKTDEMLQGITGKEWKYHVSRAPHDSLLSEKEEDIIARVEYMSEQMKLGVKAISDAIGIEIKPEHVASANKKMRAYGFKVGVLTQLAATADPPRAWRRLCLSRTVHYERAFQHRHEVRRRGSRYPHQGATRRNQGRRGRHAQGHAQGGYPQPAILHPMAGADVPPERPYGSVRLRAHSVLPPDAAAHAA